MTKEFTLENFEYEDKEKIKKIVNEKKSGLYEGNDIYGKDIIAQVQQGEDLSVNWTSDRYWGVIYNNQGERVEGICR